MEEGKAAGFDAKTVDLEEFDADTLRDTDLALFLLATYGEGEPTDNAARFITWLKDAERDLPADLLAKLKFSVFGLGNRQYEHYNRMGKLVNQRLEELGGTRVYQYGEGDDDGTLEEDFDNWKNALWDSLLRASGVSGATSEGEREIEKSIHDKDAVHRVSLDYSLTVLNAKDAETRAAQSTKSVSLSAAPGRSSSQKVQASNKHLFPFHSPRAMLVAKRELRNTSFTGCKKGEEVGSTLHLELDLSGCGLTYATADNLAIVPENAPGLVEAIASRLGWDLEEVVDFTPAADKADFKLPFPSPVSVRDLLTHCVDVQGSVRHSTAKALLAYVTDDAQKAWLGDLLKQSNRATFKAVFEESRRSFAELVLSEGPQSLSSLSLPLVDALHVLPAIQPRFYTISSSASLSPKVVHVTVGVTEYDTKREKGAVRRFTGLTSGYLRQLQPNRDSVRVFVRASTFRLPVSLSTPVLMVGPGTGIAPMRALALERRFLRASAKSNQPYGSTVLFFGCKYAQMDYIYRDELEGLHAEGALTELHTAFSRDGDKKVYVQHLLAQQDNAHRLAQWLRDGAYVYVCGATAMGADVMAAFVSLYEKEEGVTHEQAQHYFKDLQEKGRYVQELWTA